MKRLLLLFFLVHQFTNAQILIFEDFEDATVSYTLRDESNNAILTEDISQAFSDEDYFGRLELANLDPADNLGFAGFEGTSFFGANDYDGIDQTPFQITTDLVSLNWNNIDITGLSNISVSALFAEGNAEDNNEDWDNTGNFTQVRIEYSFDNTNWTSIFSISTIATPEGSPFNSTNAPPAFDPDNDGVGDGVIIDETFTELDGTFASMGNTSVSIRIYMQNLTGGDEDIAFDNFLVESACNDTAPNPVITPNPENGSSNVALGENNSINFSWENGTGDPGTTFTLNIGFLDPDEFIFPGFVNGSGLNSFANSTTYYWRVDATNCAGTTTGVVWSFTTEGNCAVSVPDQVVSVVSPTDGEIEVTINTVTDPDTVGPFQWITPSSGDPADSFILNLGLTNAGNDIGSIPNFTNGNNVGFNGWQPNTTYFWSIDAVNCAGVTSGPVWSFTTGEICTDTLPNAVINPSPTDNAENVILTGDLNALDFSWENGTGDPGTSFTLNIGTTSPDEFPFPNFLNGSGLNGLANNTTYFWRVDATNCAGTTTGTVWSFTTGETCNFSAPSSVINPSPIDGAENVILTGDLNALNFSWENGAGDPGTSFSLNIGTVSPDEITFPIFPNGSGLNGFSNGTTYFWRVDATNCGGTTIGTVWSFTTQETLSAENNQLEQLTIYPNPTSDVINIKTSLIIDKIIIFNLFGQEVNSLTKNEVRNNSINLSELANGLYLMKVFSGNKIKTLKFTKK